MPTLAEFVAPQNAPRYSFVDMGSDRLLWAVFGIVRYNKDNGAIERAVGIFDVEEPNPQRNQPVLILREEAAQQIVSGWDKVGVPKLSLTARKKAEIEGRATGDNVIQFPGPHTLQ